MLTSPNLRVCSFAEDLSDNQWHIIEIYRKGADKLQVSVDSSSPVVKLLSTANTVQFDHTSVMYLGGRFALLPLLPA